MKIDGTCHCGAIAYEAEVDPDRAVICHCTDCQALSGAPWRAVIGARIFTITRGKPTIYEKTADSGAIRVQGFCGTCGSPIYSTSPDEPRIYSLRVGTVRQREQITPSRQIWRGSAMPWAMDIHDIPSVDGQT